MKSAFVGEWTIQT